MNVYFGVGKFSTIYYMHRKCIMRVNDIGTHTHMVSRLSLYDVHIPLRQSIKRSKETKE